MVTRSNIALCNICHKRTPDAVGGVMCVVCYNRELIAQWTNEQCDALVAESVPALFKDSRIDHLKPELIAKFKAETFTGIFLWGGAGVGKSYAMAALMREYIIAGFDVKRVTYELLCLWLRDTFKQKADATEWMTIQPFIQADMLFIEDIGTTKSIGSIESDFSVRTLQVLLDARLERCRPTFITSNKSLENITNSFDERIGSRLKMLSVIKLTGDDRRG